MRLNDSNKQVGASTWLTNLPIKDEGYVFSKQRILGLNSN